MPREVHHPGAPERTDVAISLRGGPKLATPAVNIWGNPLCIRELPHGPIARRGTAIGGHLAGYLPFP